MISVSADCQCSHLNILESCAVAVRGKERDSGRGGGECHTTWRKWQANTCFVAERRGNAGVTVIKRVLPCMAKQVLICSRCVKMEKKKRARATEKGCCGGI